jgi:peptidyl-prolyl cis-trans isomerase C
MLLQMIKVIRIIMFLSCFVFIINCSNKQAAVVNGTVIYENEVLDSLKDVNSETVEKMGKESVKKNILEGLVNKQLLLCKIKEVNYAKDDSLQKLWQPYKREATIKYFINTYLPENQTVPGKVLQDEYNKKKELFKTEGQVHTRHILIRTGKGLHTDEEAQNKINQIAREVKKDGSNFAEMAKKNSECPSSTQGGDLGFIVRGQMVKPFEDAAFSLKKGEVTQQPIKTTYGYHLIYAEGIKEATYPSIDELKKQLLPGIYISDMEKEYGLVVHAGKDRSNENLGEIKKLNLKYNIKAFREDLDTMLGKAGALKYIQSETDISNIVRELLYLKIFEDKMKNFAVDKDEKYQKYIQKIYDEFLFSNYLENIVFRDVMVSEAEVQYAYRANLPMEVLIQQYGQQFSTDAAFRNKIEMEQILPYVRQQLKEQKKSEVFMKTIDELKKKYPVDIKIEYKAS